MMFKSKLVTFAGALILAGSAFASQQQGCPDINDIKAEGLNMAEQIAMGYYATYNISHYNTDYSWGFIIGPVEANDEESALEGANFILSEMTAPGVPDQNLCEYDTGISNMLAVAIRDDDQGNISPMKFKQYLKHVR